jgi:hypothetical protein
VPTATQKPAVGQETALSPLYALPVALSPGPPPAGLSAGSGAAYDRQAPFHNKSMSPDKEPVVSVYWPTIAQKPADAQDASKKFTLGFAPGAAPDMSLVGRGASPGAPPAGPVAPSCQLATGTGRAGRRTRAFEEQPAEAKAIRRQSRQASAAVRRAHPPKKADVPGGSTSTVTLLRW